MTQGVARELSNEEGEESLLEDVRVELLQCLADLVGEKLPPVAVVQAVEFLAGVEGSRYETPPSFEFSLLGRVPRFLLQRHFAPQDRRRQISVCVCLFGFLSSPSVSCWPFRFPVLGFVFLLVAGGLVSVGCPVGFLGPCAGCWLSPFPFSFGLTWGIVAVELPHLFLYIVAVLWKDGVDF
ncbi:hypothetical protein M5K25_001104 [Dendrobium thyrsiflorum]|uniref:Uncharacterized protein n=1 Tax=Dendrobium thyrsiflorum TaxID=117978 RepID=A0ABD0VVZ9_DENTH